MMLGCMHQGFSEVENKRTGSRTVLYVYHFCFELFLLVQTAIFGLYCEWMDGCDPHLQALSSMVLAVKRWHWMDNVNPAVEERLILRVRRQFVIQGINRQLYADVGPSRPGFSRSLFHSIFCVYPPICHPSSFPHQSSFQLGRKKQKKTFGFGYFSYSMKTAEVALFFRGYKQKLYQIVWPPGMSVSNCWTQLKKKGPLRMAEQQPSNQCAPSSCEIPSVLLHRIMAC